MSIKKADVKHLEELLNKIKEPYPRFTEAISGCMGYLSEAQFFDFIKWLEDNPDSSTDDVCIKVDTYHTAD